MKQKNIILTELGQTQFAHSFIKEMLERHEADLKKVNSLRETLFGKEEEEYPKTEYQEGVESQLVEIAEMLYDSIKTMAEFERVAEIDLHAIQADLDENLESKKDAK